MADIAFRITEGPYAGTYELDIKDISASDVGDLLAQGGPDLDMILTAGAARGMRAIASLVWLVRRRGGSKGLSYKAVADHINMAIVEPIEEPGETAEKSLHPSTSDDD